MKTLWITLIFLSFGFQAFAVQVKDSSKFKKSFERDKNNVFMRICKEAFGRKAGACASYKRRGHIKGEEMSSVHRDINSTMKLILKRGNKYLKREFENSDIKLPLRIGQVRKYFRGYFEDRGEDNKDYLNYVWTGELPAPKKPATRVVIAKRPKPVSTQVVVQVKKELFPSENYPEISRSIILKACYAKVSRLRAIEEEEFTREDKLACHKLGDQLQGKKFSKILAGINDSMLEISLSPELLLSLFEKFTLDKPVKVTSPTKKKTRKLIVKSTKFKPVSKPKTKQATQSNKSLGEIVLVKEYKGRGDATQFALTAKERLACQEDINVEVCEAMLLARKKRSISNKRDVNQAPSSLETKIAGIKDQGTMKLVANFKEKSLIDLMAQIKLSCSIYPENNPKFSAKRAACISDLTIKAQQELEAIVDLILNSRGKAKIKEQKVAKTVPTPKSTVPVVIASKKPIEVISIPKLPIAKVIKPIAPSVESIKDKPLEIKVENNREVARVKDKALLVTASEADSASCEDEVKKKMLELLKADEDNILGKQFHLTSLKLTLQVLQKRKSPQTRTVEQLIKKDKEFLQGQNAKSITDKLIKFYKKHGKRFDKAEIARGFKKMNRANYFKKKNRLYNESASVYILADSISNKENSLFSEVDAASAWFASKVNQKVGKLGSKRKNLTNLSSLVFRQIEVLGKKKSDVLAKSLEVEAELNILFQQMRNKVELDLAHCFSGNGGTCMTKDEFNQAFTYSLMSLSEKIMTDESFNLEVDRSLLGVVGDGFKFDFLPRY